MNRLAAIIIAILAVIAMAWGLAQETPPPDGAWGQVQEPRP